MEEELENGIALMDGILDNWKEYNPVGKYQMFFPKCLKENDVNFILFPIFEENTKGTLILKVWGKYNLEKYVLEEYIEAKNKIILFDKKLINYKKKKFAKNVIALINIFYTAQEFMNLPEDSIEYIANQELLDEKIDDYKKAFKTILENEELAILYGVKQNDLAKKKIIDIPKKTNNKIEKNNNVEQTQIVRQNNLEKVPAIRGRKKKINDNVITEAAETIGNMNYNLENVSVATNIGQMTKTRKLDKIDYSKDFDDPYQELQTIPMQPIQYQNTDEIMDINFTPKKSKRGRKPKQADLTIKRLQECISKINHKNNTKEKYMLKLMEEVGELAKDVNENVRMQGKEIKGTIEEELQDVLYYVVCLANTFDIDLEECIYLKEKLNCKKYNRKNMFEE